ncbi:MAG: PH domain-containing protein [Acidimicrobiia bacterium]
MDSSLRIDQPLVNKVSMLVVLAVAAYGLFALADSFRGALLVVVASCGIVALGWFAFRTLRITATADRNGMEVRNLFATEQLAWGDIMNVSVQDNTGGRGSGIVVDKVAGDPVSVESSWGPWYQGRGRIAVANEKRCAWLLAEIEEIRPPT